MSIYSSTLLDFFSRNFLTKPSPEATAPKPSSYDVIHAGEHTLKVAVHSMLKEGDTMLTSGPFSVGGHDWAIAYFPNGDSRIVDGQFTSVFLKLLSASEDEVTATYTFSLQDPAWSVTGEKNKRGPATAKFSSNQLGWGTPKFVSKAALTASGCLKDDCLVIKCTVKIVTTKLMKDHEDDGDDNSVVVCHPPISTAFLIASSSRTRLLRSVGSRDSRCMGACSLHSLRSFVPWWRARETASALTIWMSTSSRYCCTTCTMRLCPTSWRRPRNML